MSSNPGASCLAGYAAMGLLREIPFVGLYGCIQGIVNNSPDGSIDRYDVSAIIIHASMDSLQICLYACGLMVGGFACWSCRASNCGCLFPRSCFYCIADYRTVLLFTAFAGTGFTIVRNLASLVIPAKAGIQYYLAALISAKTIMNMAKIYL